MGMVEPIRQLQVPKNHDYGTNFAENLIEKLCKGPVSRIEKKLSKVKI
jgi:hypothetical protein